MAKVDEGFTIKLPKKGSNKMLLPIVAMLAFLFVSIAFGMYIYEPAKDVAKPVATITTETHKTTDNQNTNNIASGTERKESSVLAEKSSPGDSVIVSNNTGVGQEKVVVNPVQEFKQVLNFDFDSTAINAYDDRSLQQFLTDNKDKKLKIIIDGHTDSIGSEDYNQDLSERRADSVEQEIMKMSTVQQDNITKKITGYGETKPVDTNDTSEGRANNRRVELKIIVLQ